MADTLEIFGVEYTNVAGIIATTPNETDLTYIRPQGTKSISANGTGIDVTEYASVDVNVPTGSAINNQDKTVNPSTSQQTITADSGYTGLSTVIVNAMPTGTAGTPTATKGTVSNHSISVTPSVTNITGYITGSTKTGTAVTVSASELVSGTLYCDEDGSWDVTNAETFVVKTGTVNNPTATKGTVTNHSVTVTPSVSHTQGWISSGTKTGTTVTVTASELVSGNKAISSNGTNIDVTNYATVSVSVDSGGGITPTGNINITQAGETDVTNYATATVPTADIHPWLDYDFTTRNGVLKFNFETGYAVDDNDGWVSESDIDNVLFDAVPANTTITPSTSSQTVGGVRYVMEGPVTVAAMPSGTAGTPIATKGAVSNHSISVTPSVTNITGYITGSTKTGTAVTVSASELVSGNKSIVAAGNSIDVTDYATVSVASGSATAPATVSGTAATVSTGTNTLTLTKTVSVTPTVSAGYVSSGTAGNSSVSLTASVTTKAAATITPTTSNQTIAAGTYLTGAQTIAGDSNLVASNIKKNVPIFGVTGTYEGSGGGEDSGMTVATATQTLSSAASDIVFTGLAGEPTSFVVLSAENLTVGTPSKIAVVAYDGSTCHGQLITNTSNAQVSYTSTGPYFTYSNGTLAIVDSGADFEANTYKLVYTYGGTSSNIDTADVQVGSGATSITFTGLTAEPDYFSCIFKSNFSTSSGYQRVIVVVYDGTSVYGLEMDSGAHYSSAHWSYTYTNGSLTITSQSTNAGGYFHQPGYYQLTYGIGGTIAPVNIEVEPLSVTQNGTYTAPSGKAYSPVTVAVSGGGGANIDTKSVTNSSNQNTSINFTSMKGEPKAFFVRCTATLSRSSSNTYYYVADMVYDGDTTNGNMHARSNGQYSNITSGYSWSYSGTTLTLTSSGARNRSPGSFYNGTYELVYIY